MCLGDGDGWYAWRTNNCPVYFGLTHISPSFSLSFHQASLLLYVRYGIDIGLDQVHIIVVLHEVGEKKKKKKKKGAMNTCRCYLRLRVLVYPSTSLVLKTSTTNS